MYLVTGATGDLGRRIVRQLRHQQQPVRAFVRLTANYTELERRGADICVGDLRQPRDLARACEGVQYIISAHGSGSSVDGAQALDYRANIDLIEAGRGAGVRHFVFTSVLGADRPYEDAPVFKAKRAVEAYLGNLAHAANAEFTYTILRPSGLASNLLPLAERFRQTGIYVLIGDPKARTSIVSTDDVAQLAIAACTTPAACNQTFAVGGPDILQRSDIPKIFGQLFQRTPIVLNPPLVAVDGVRTLLGWVNPAAREALGTFRTLLADEFFCTPDEIMRLEATFGISLERLEAFIRRYLNP